MKKRLTLVLALVCLLAILAGCTSAAPQIAPMPLSASQQEIVDLISRAHQEILLFEYTLGGAFHEMEVWLEVYHYGELQETFLTMHMLDGQIQDGQLAIVMQGQWNNELQWTISTVAANEGASTTGPTWVADSAHEPMSRVFGMIQEPVSIESGQEIILYVSKLATSYELIHRFDLQHYLEHPEDFAAYTYVHLIKTRFS